jgi:hypothetical protein
VTPCCEVIYSKQPGFCLPASQMVRREGLGGSRLRKAKVVVARISRLFCIACGSTESNSTGRRRRLLLKRV